jgi:hypothetical protein
MYLLGGGGYLLYQAELGSVPRTLSDPIATNFTGF